MCQKMQPLNMRSFKNIFKNLTDLNSFEQSCTQIKKLLSSLQLNQLNLPFKRPFRWWQESNVQ